jgi:hypothetical protein
VSIYSVDALATAPAATTPARLPRLDVMVGVGLLIVAGIVGLATAADYGLTIDEFNTDDYGPKALAWYTSLGADRSHFEDVEQFLWYYGPWNQILIAFVQSLDIADPIAVRHALTFLTGLAGLAALIPIARLSVGAWAGPIAILLCLVTGYFYGSLFFTPIDVPFMAAMTWATWAILAMARTEIPGWPAIIAAGLFTGLAMATRTGGVITHAYLLGAIGLCALEALIRYGHKASKSLLQIAGRTLAAIVLAWITTIALWPWLQIGNPIRQFAIAHAYFMHSTLSFDFPSWGRMVRTDALPWTYVPEQLLARLPEVFLLLLALAIVLGVVILIRWGWACLAGIYEGGITGLKSPALLLARARLPVVVAVAAIGPIAVVIVLHTPHYDGIRHLLFVIPMLALVAGGALLEVAPFLRRYRSFAGALLLMAAVHVGSTVVTMLRLHPLEYVAMNALAGGTRNAAGRFELDYWGAAATEAVRMLERRLDADRSGTFASQPPRVYVCVNDREWAADDIFRRSWMLAEEPTEADFIIETERWPCAQGMQAVLIDQVERFGVSFARIYGYNRGRALAKNP